MPWFTLQHKSKHLPTIHGYVLDFKKGERTWVPPACVPDVLAIGAVPDEPLTEESTVEGMTQPETAAERKQKIFDVFEKLFLRSRRGDFSASGLPSLAKVNELLGFDIAQKERDEMWVEYIASRNEKVNE